MDSFISYDDRHRNVEVSWCIKGWGIQMYKKKTCICPMVLTFRVQLYQVLVIRLYDISSWNIWEMVKKFD